MRLGDGDGVLEILNGSQVDESQSSGKISLGLSVVMRVTLRDGTYHEVRHFCRFYCVIWMAYNAGRMSDMAISRIARVKPLLSRKLRKKEPQMR